MQAFRAVVISTASSHALHQFYKSLPFGISKQLITPIEALTHIPSRLLTKVIPTRIGFNLGIETKCICGSGVGGCCGRPSGEQGSSVCKHSICLNLSLEKSHEYGMLHGKVYGVMQHGEPAHLVAGNWERIMRITAAVLTLLVSGSALAADVWVQPHVRSDGTFVQGHYRTAPDSNPYNNYSTQGNVNPYTGQQGSVNPYATPQPVYPQQQQCHKDIYGNLKCY